MLNSSLQNREKELKCQLNESNEKRQRQLVYITGLETTLVDTDRILKELSDDILKKEREFKSCKGRQPALTIFWRHGTQNLTYNNVGSLYVVNFCFSVKNFCECNFTLYAVLAMHIKLVFQVMFMQEKLISLKFICRLKLRRKIYKAEVLST